MPQAIVKPANQIVAFGDPLVVEMEIGANATAVKMLPGRVVIFDDTDQTVKEAGAKAMGEVGVLDVVAGKLKTANYVVGDQAPVILGECLVLLTLLASENVTRGDALVTDEDILLLLLFLKF
jgi:hypothetical protein